MPDHVSLLEELRVQYEAARKSPHDHADVPGFKEIDAQLRKAFRWLEKAIAYLDGLQRPIERRFDLGHGVVFEKLHFEHGFVGQHEQRIVGFPVLDEINVTYQIVAPAPASIEIASASFREAERILDGAGLQYTATHVEDHTGTVRRCAMTIRPQIPAAISFRADYRTGLVPVSLVNVDRFDRLSLEFQSKSIDDLVRLILGRSDAFLHRAPLVGIHGRPTG